MPPMTTARKSVTWALFWEEKSNGKGLFLMTVVEKGGKTLFEQIAAKMKALK